jgi:hypothetical protein
LSFSHHAEVASLPPKIADEMLDWAASEIVTEGNPASCRELRDKVQNYKVRLFYEKAPRPGTTAADLQAAAASLQREATGLADMFSNKPSQGIKLDNSGVDGPVPEDLRNLTTESAKEDNSTAIEPPVIDRLGIAQAAVAQLSLEETILFFSKQAASLPEAPPAEERPSVKISQTQTKLYQDALLENVRRLLADDEVAAMLSETIKIKRRIDDPDLVQLANALSDLAERAKHFAEQIWRRNKPLTIDHESPSEELGQ